MRWFITFSVFSAIGLLASQCHAQATGGGMGNMSIGPGNMNIGATMANSGPNGGFAAGPTGAGAGNRSTTDASISAGATNFAGAYPQPGVGRYPSQNRNTAMGTNLAAPAVATRPGQPLTLNRSRSMFSSRSAMNYNQAGRSNFGGAFNGQRGFNGQGFGGANFGGGPSYNAPRYGQAGTTQSYGPMNYRLNNLNVPGYYTGRAYNGLPMFNGNRSLYGGATAGGSYGAGPASNFQMNNGFMEGAY